VTPRARAALAAVRAAGGDVKLRGGRLKVVAPAPLPAELMERLRAVKPDLLAALAPPEPERAGWGAADWRAFFGERAAVREYDGRRPRAEAERLAWGETLAEWHKANASPPPSWQCAGCGERLSGAQAMTLPDAARVHDVAGYGCLIAYGRHWRAAATEALAAMGIEPPDRLAPRMQQ